MPAAPQKAPVTASLMINVVDGTRQPINTPELLIRILNGRQSAVHTGTFAAPTILFRDLPVEDNLDDRFTVIASAPEYRQAGFTPVVVRRGVLQTVNLMLLPREPRFNFRSARWENLRNWDPAVADLLARGAPSEDAARDRYSQLLETRPDALACFLNLAEAMSAISLPTGSPLTYMREIVWDETIGQDRFFVWCDCALIEQVREAADQGVFDQIAGSGFFHPGATLSYKQKQFGEANVQLTFHEGETRTINGLNCVLVEPDIDYFQDVGAHALLEVIPNTLTGGKTDPMTVYNLRWIAGRHAGVPAFEPPYVIEAA